MRDETTVTDNHCGECAEYESECVCDCPGCDPLCFECGPCECECHDGGESADEDCEP